ncbi:hypothetical protein [Bifidobacterium platyrrhinorum]|uniref:Uncharacterized protein n=1 Tax=Bifidobacterium platyrrhinorum TaxID=2661628 RepID=A0A6L9SSD7_9BIFI|nr:hypothetical protein [Bifidobacterium platyrrhinorum]NEG55434.1 hypothetical protein [Bifidobacterium platyrrhinorum]
MSSYQLPNIPGHVAGKKAVLTINDGETVVKGRIASVTVASDGLMSSGTIAFDSGCVPANIREDVPHVLEVED